MQHCPPLEHSHLASLALQNISSKFRQFTVQLCHTWLAKTQAFSPFPCSCGSKDVVREEENKNVGMLSTCLGYYSCLVQRIPRPESARTLPVSASIFYTSFKQELRLSSNRTTDSMLAMSPASPPSAGDGIATDCAETVVSSPTYDGTFHSRPVSGRPPTWKLKNGLCHSTPTVTVESLVEMYGKYASVQFHCDFKSIALNQMPKNSVWWKITAWSLSFNLRLGIQMCICNCGNLQCKMSPHCSKNAIAGEQCTVNCISQESKPARPVCHCLSAFVCTVHCLQEVLATSSHLVHTLVARISNGQLPVVELVAHRCGRS